MLRSNFYSALCGKPNFAIKKREINFPKGRNFRKVIEKKRFFNFFCDSEIKTPLGVNC